MKYLDKLLRLFQAKPKRSKEQDQWFIALKYREKDIFNLKNFFIESFNILLLCPNIKHPPPEVKSIYFFFFEKINDPFPLRKSILFIPYPSFKIFILIKAPLILIWDDNFF